MNDFHSEAIDHDRRRFFGTAAMTIAAAQFGLSRAAEAQAATTNPAAVPAAHASFGPLKQIDAGLLNIGYAEAGPSDGSAVISCTAGPTTSTATSTLRRCWRRPA